jgi:hypothetical protein
MKRGIQGVTRREQPKLPITMSVASAIVLESLRNSQKYNLHFREISWGLIRTEKCADLVSLWLSLNVLFEPDTCRSLASCEGRECRRSCHSRPVNRNSVTSHRLSLPGAVILLRLPVNARRDSLRHCIPPGFSLVVPCVFHCSFHFSPRYGILPL